MGDTRHRMSGYNSGSGGYAPRIIHDDDRAYYTPGDEVGAGTWGKVYRAYDHMNKRV